MLLMLRNMEQCICCFGHSIGCEGLAGFKPIFTALRKCAAIGKSKLSRLVYSFCRYGLPQNLGQAI